MAKDNGNVNIPGGEDEFSLESILAEYKGSAFIAGDRKTPTEILNEKADRIIMEETGRLPALSEKEDDVPAPVEEETSPPPEETPPAPPEMPAAPEEAEEEPPPVDGADEIEAEERFFEDFQFSSPGAVEKYSEEVTKAINAEEDREEPKKSFLSGLFTGRHRDGEHVELSEPEEDIPEDTPSLAEEAQRFSKGLNSLAMRTLAAFVISAVMALFTLIFEGGKSVPFGIGENQLLLTGVLLVMQIIVMMLGIDVILTGIKDFIMAAPGGESLAVISCLFTMLNGIIMLATGNVGSGLPFSVVSAFSLAFTMQGRKLYKAAMKDSLRMAVASSSPSGVMIERGDLEDRVVIKKTPGSINGFYRKLTQADISENVYDLAAPMFLIASLIFAILIGLVKGATEHIAFSFAAMISVSASFSSVLAYSLPFSLSAKYAKTSGGAIAGWGGACDIYDADGVLITDEDIFPTGTVSLSGVKAYEGVSQNKLIAYTASVVIASGSGLAKVFAELLKSSNMPLLRVDDFAVYEGGGIGAVVRDERVLVGSGAFMSLMGIRVPDGINVKNAVFSAINDQLAAVFTVNYVPSNSVQNALVSITKSKIGMILAVRDFNVTPLMIQQKFKVDFDDLEYIPQEDSYRISDKSVPKGSHADAVLCREGLGPFAEVITKGRKFKIVAELMTGASVIGSVIGILLMFFLCWAGSFDSASAGSALKYMFCIHIVVLLISLILRRRD